jgi:hypothetical protein
VVASVVTTDGMSGRSAPRWSPDGHRHGIPRGGAPAFSGCGRGTAGARRKLAGNMTIGVALATDHQLRRRDGGPRSEGGRTGSAVGLVRAAARLRLGRARSHRGTGGAGPAGWHRGDPDLRPPSIARLVAGTDHTGRHARPVPPRSRAGGEIHRRAGVRDSVHPARRATTGVPDRVAAAAAGRPSRFPRRTPDRGAEHARRSARCPATGAGAGRRDGTASAPRHWRARRRHAALPRRAEDPERAYSVGDHCGRGEDASRRRVRRRGW